jgi:hypothetical protein
VAHRRGPRLSRSCSSGTPSLCSQLSPPRAACGFPEHRSCSSTGFSPLRSYSHRRRTPTSVSNASAQRPLCRAAPATAHRANGQRPEEMSGVWHFVGVLVSAARCVRPRQCRWVLRVGEVDQRGRRRGRRLPQGAIASPLNHPQRDEGCDQHQHPGHDPGPGAKASEQGGHHGGCGDRAHAERCDYCEQEYRWGCPRWIQHAETLAQLVHLRGTDHARLLVTQGSHASGVDADDCSDLNGVVRAVSRLVAMSVETFAAGVARCALAVVLVSVELWVGDGAQDLPRARQL